jgi:hypothetical protein
LCIREKNWSPTNPPTNSRAVADSTFAKLPWRKSRIVIAEDLDSKTARLVAVEDGSNFPTLGTGSLWFSRWGYVFSTGEPSLENIEKYAALWNAYNLCGTMISHLLQNLFFFAFAKVTNKLLEMWSYG